MKLIVSAPPHIKEDISIEKIMWSTVIALLPVTLMAVYVFGLSALYIVLICVLTAVLVELILQKMSNKRITIKDGNAVLIGLLLALLFPPNVPLWIPIIGVIIAMVFGKHAFGGLGHTIFNPSLVGVAFLMISWPALMTFASTPRFGASLPYILEYGATRLADASPLAMIGALYLLYKRYIDWRIPLSFIVTLALFALLLRIDLSSIFTGVLILGVFFLATDHSTTPVTKIGRFIFGAGCGALIIIYGQFGNYFEGICYSILLMNCFTALIDLYTVPNPSRRYMSWLKKN
ncbi:MAG: RnfABCDGE type electron transport complex subunit D [Methanocellales archaeon]|nr:RnfABCDGE type electron transport complex subunit D [Methanocellales archaeon]MDD3421182.1 RnfABCDGE type electron transport complex subunit D [Methanocellales archaeon]MDD4897961.1 RnfABCDGE type electron transport complex subunit D [Methanocellales archaeon]MDD5447103.1 RnfABCDGE type electron transport complex subunit D [Methanocellales archaeon]